MAGGGLFMNLSRDELLKQKEIIESHLAWLNQMIAQLPNTGLTVPPQSDATPVEVQEPVATLSNNAASQSPILQAAPLVSTAAPTPDIAAAATAHSQDFDPTQFATSRDSMGITTMQKAGCIFVAVAICLSFLGLLFGEYIWDKIFPDEDQKTEVREEVSPN